MPHDSSARLRHPPAPSPSLSQYCSPETPKPLAKPPAPSPLQIRSKTFHLLTRILSLLLLTLALFIIPASIHALARNLDTIYELVGRRARTTFDEVGWRSMGVGAGVLVMWHLVLVAVSWKVAGDGKGWGRVLGRVVVPVYLFAAGLLFLIRIGARFNGPVVKPVLEEGRGSSVVDE